jgi:sialic acid synthase
MPRTLTIDGQAIQDDGECYVIAEVGHNHQGSVQKCRELFRVAKECGADAVKLQKRDNRSLYTRAMFDKPYDNENSFGATYGEHREALEFGRDEYRELQQYCRELGIGFFATAFDIPSADFLAELDMPAYKIASGDLKTLPLLTHVARIGKPIIVSTGGATLADIERAYDAIAPINPQVAFLQCTAAYPASAEELNLRVITTLRERFPDSVIGLSDHENGIAMAVAAYVLGARIVEKHFTLNHTDKGTDHAFSLEPIGMRKLVRDLRRTRAALGDGVKRPLPSERQPLLKMGKKLVASRKLCVGQVLGPEDVVMKSPGDGLSPGHLPEVIGRTLLAPLEPDDDIRFELLGQGEAE